MADITSDAPLPSRAGDQLLCAAAASAGILAEHDVCESGHALMAAKMSSRLATACACAASVSCHRCTSTEAAWSQLIFNKMPRLAQAQQKLDKICGSLTGAVSISKQVKCSRTPKAKPSLEAAACSIASNGSPICCRSAFARLPWETCVATKRKLLASNLALINCLTKSIPSCDDFSMRPCLQ
jgi:hypothetical protein